jgi:hypothetical protein
VLPPQADGGVGEAGDLVSTPSQPPDALTVRSQAANLASMAACVWQAASVVLFGQDKVTVGVVTVNVAVH